MLLLVPADLLRPRRADAHFAAEVEAARAAGVPVALVDHDALTRPDGAVEAVARVPADTDDAVYRGWMLGADRYAAFAAALGDRGVRLRTDPARYRRAHELPGWYDALAAATPESVWTVGADRDEFARACARLSPGPAVLRDYCKSMKHHWSEAMFIPDVADGDAAWAVASRFLDLRGEDFAGGLVLRRFEEFTGAEVRTWWVDGTCRLVTAHPDTPDRHPPATLDPTGYQPLVAALDLPFVTVDLATRADGVQRIVELGDGQVSDRPADTSPESLVAALRARA